MFSLSRLGILVMFNPSMPNKMEIKFFFSFNLTRFIIFTIMKHINLVYLDISYVCNFFNDCMYLNSTINV